MKLHRLPLAVLLVLLAAGGRAAPENPAPATFSSELAFTVWCESGLGLPDSWKSLGRTPAPEPIHIPACDAWGIEPEDKTTFAQAIAAATAARATGVASTYSAPATEQDLAVLRREMPDLRVFFLWESPAITDAGVDALKDFPDLRHLALQHLKTITDASLAGLSEFKALQWLEVGYCDRITPAGLARLKDIAGLKVLELSGDQINDAALAELAGLDRLTSLNLSWCDHITDAGLVHLQALPALRILNLAKTPITDAGLVHLRELKGLRSLNLRACVNLTDTAVVDLRRALPATEIAH